MTPSVSIPVRMLLVGSGAGEFRTAAEMARRSGAEVATADTVAAALESLRADGVELVMIDVRLDVAGLIDRLRAERMAVPVLACGIDAPAALAVAAIRAGARDYVPLPPQGELIAAAIMSVANHSVEMIGEDIGYRRAVEFGMAMAPAELPIVIVGEDGCGKETMARAIHQASGRAGRFIAVGCAGVPSELLEAELFGQEAGAFDGAVAARRGRVEEAAGGTLYLRDLDAAAPSVQERLLQVLDQGAVRRLGGHAKIPVSVRIIGGARRPIHDAVDADRLRSDLAARLDLVKVMMPSLQARRDDIRRMAAHFARKFALLNGVAVPEISATALQVLDAYRWPGNVRELEHVMLRAVLLSAGAVLGADHLRLADGTKLAEIAPEAPAGGGLEVRQLVGHTMADVERELILETLDRCNGNRTSASSILGISVRTMRNKIRSFIEAGIAVAPTA